jgi:hypothetical protein
MELWLYKIKEFWLLNKRELKRYGLCALVIWTGFRQSVPVVVILGFIMALIMWAYDTWGRTWAERGRLVAEEKRLRRKHS